MSGVQLDDDGKVLNSKINLVKFLMRASYDVICSNIAAIDIQQPVAILDGIRVHLLLHERTSSNKQRFLVAWVAL